MSGGGLGWGVSTAAGRHAGPQLHLLSWAARRACHTAQGGPEKADEPVVWVTGSYTWGADPQREQVLGQAGPGDQPAHLSGRAHDLHSTQHPCARTPGSVYTQAQWSGPWAARKL